MDRPWIAEWAYAGIFAVAVRIQNQDQFWIYHPWIAEWAYAGMFAVAVRIQNQDQFWIYHQKNQGCFFNSFRKVEK